MKKSLVYFLFILIALGTVLQSCSEDNSYADMKEREKSMIGGFLSTGACVKNEWGDTTLYVKPIKVISEKEFADQDSTTDVSKNEYVLFNGPGVYMQIIRKGPGKKLEDGKSATILMRFVEYNIAGDSIQTHNTMSYQLATVPDIMTCENSYGVFTASYTSGVMMSSYSASVPTGWLIPLSYINLGRQFSEDSEVAKVRLIIPHTQGQMKAQEYVYPCFYEITYQRGIN